MKVTLIATNGTETVLENCDQIEFMDANGDAFTAVVMQDHVRITGNEGAIKITPTMTGGIFLRVDRSR